MANPQSTDRSTAHDILMLQRAEPAPVATFESLQRKGFTVRLIKDISEVASTLQKLADPILLVDCGLFPGSLEFLTPLFAKPEVLQFPVLVLGKDVEGLEGRLSKHFCLAATLRHPCAPSEVVEGIRYLCKIYRKGVPEPEAPAQTAKVPLPSEPELDQSLDNNLQPTSEQDIEELPLEQCHKLYSKEEAISSLVFEKLKEFDLSERELGGKTYPFMSRLSDQEKLQVLPPDDNVVAAFKALSEEAGRWGMDHFCRTAEAALCLISPLGYEPGLVKSTRISALLFAFAFNSKNRSLLRKEYLGRGTLLLRKELCSLIKDSALQLGMVLNLTEPSSIVAALAKLIGRESLVTDAPVSIAASAIMAADYTDRVCFASGSWNPRAAYQLIRRIKAGKMRDFHPAVLCTLMKYLSEAVAASPSAIVLTKSVRENPKLKAFAKAQREQVISGNEKKVEIAALAPGMKLSKPVYSFDGRKLLSEDLTLDQDLIWRIWQLSALRPINAPVVVQSKNEEDSEDDEE